MGGSGGAPPSFMLGKSSGTAVSAKLDVATLTAVMVTNTLIIAPLEQYEARLD